MPSQMPSKARRPSGAFEDLGSSVRTAALPLELPISENRAHKLLQLCHNLVVSMYRCAVRLQIGFLPHFHRSQLPPIPPLPSASDSPLLPKFKIPRLSRPFAWSACGSSIATAAQVRSNHSRCKAPAGGQGAAMIITDMDFSTQAKPGLAKTFWESCRREAYASLYNPFVVSLAAGTLPKPAFQRYMAQDAYFLKAFKSGYQVAMESTEDEDAKATLDSLMRSAQEELTLHSSVMQSLDVTDDEKGFEPNMATVAYCEFLQFAAAGSNSDALQSGMKSANIIAAMTPCMRLYAFLGQEIQKHIKHVPHHPYQGWIDTYAAAEFEAAASKVEQLLDKLTEALTGDNEAVLYNLYRQAMNLEVDFFNAQLLLEPVLVHVPLFKSQENRRLLLVSDFDSTCTISDSCPVLADLTLQIAGKTHGGGRSVGDSGASLLRKKWDELVMRYMDEYEEVLNRSLSNIDRGKAPTAEHLREFLKEMSEFEQKANARVEEAQVLKGLSPAAIRDAGNAMPLREGCSDFFKRLESAQEFHVDTHILSVCWSKTFIEAVLEQGDIHISNVNANEFDFEDNMSTGKMIRNVETALDKQKHFVHILDELRVTKPTDPQVLSVYVGDSLTDLLCLLRADVGIVLGDSSTLKQVYGANMSSLFRKALILEQAGVDGGSQTTLSGCVFTVSSWYEVEAFLLGPARAWSKVL